MTPPPMTPSDVSATLSELKRVTHAERPGQVTQRREVNKEKGLVLTSCISAFLFQIPKHGTHAPFVPIILHLGIITAKTEEWIKVTHANRAGCGNQIFYKHLSF